MIQVAAAEARLDDLIFSSNRTDGSALSPAMRSISPPRVLSHEADGMHMLIFTIYMYGIFSFKSNATTYETID